MSLQMKSPAPRCGAETGLEETSTLGRLDGPEISTKSGRAQAEIEAAAHPAGNGKGKDANDLVVEQGPGALRAYMHASESIPFERSVESNGSANEAGAKPRKARANGKDKQPVVIPSEDALALTLVERFDDQIRYVSMWGKWLRWAGEHWKIEKTPRRVRPRAKNLP
jgi:hypothetical protein